MAPTPQSKQYTTQAHIKNVRPKIMLNFSIFQSNSKSYFIFTHMFTRHIAHITHVHDATLMSNHADSDGVFTHLGRHVFVHLDAQIFQHQQTWADAEVCQCDPQPAEEALPSFTPLKQLKMLTKSPSSSGVFSVQYPKI